MSLRVRLTLLNMFIIGGILLLFGTAIYLTVSYTLTNQVDSTLTQVGKLIVRSLSVDQRGGLSLETAPNLGLSTGVYYQIWGRDGRLQYISTNLQSFISPLDPQATITGETVVRDAVVNDVHLRVLTIPLALANNNRVIGALQVGTSMTVVDSALQTLLAILLIGSGVAMSIAGLAGWFSISQALKPLNLVTQTALQITRADDLSRRIPYQGPQEDEIGQLILAFNQTLSRLENLFNSQRRFLADVGHELRTPLTVIKGNVDLMRRMNCTDEESMDGIESEVDRLTRMVGDLLLLAQAESGKMPLAHRTVELDTLVLEVMQQMRVLARERMALKLGEIDQVIVCGDIDRLKQVLVNLVGNAIQYTPSGGTIMVGVGKEASLARITVSDTGPGIPAEDLPFIFERFYRGEKARTRPRNGKGYGLGLSIAYWIVRNHGGNIDVAQNLPHGTVFTVMLPLAEGKCRDEMSQP